jgi:hypothetical protein
MHACRCVYEKGVFVCENLIAVFAPEIDATAREDYLASLWLRPCREHADDNALTKVAKVLVLKRERAVSGLEKDYLVTTSVYCCSRAVESTKRKSSC